MSLKRYPHGESRPERRAHVRAYLPSRRTSFPEYWRSFCLAADAWRKRSKGLPYDRDAIAAHDALLFRLGPFRLYCLAYRRHDEHRYEE
jgi:hypothetical protein